MDSENVTLIKSIVDAKFKTSVYLPFPFVILRLIKRKRVINCAHLFNKAPRLHSYLGDTETIASHLQHCQIWSARDLNSILES